MEINDLNGNQAQNSITPSVVDYDQHIYVDEEHEKIDYDAIITSQEKEILNRYGNQHYNNEYTILITCDGQMDPETQALKNTMDIMSIPYTTCDLSMKQIIYKHKTTDKEKNNKKKDIMYTDQEQIKKIKEIISEKIQIPNKYKSSKINVLVDIGANSRMPFLEDNVKEKYGIYYHMSDTDRFAFNAFTQSQYAKVLQTIENDISSKAPESELEINTLACSADDREMIYKNTGNKNSPSFTQENDIPTPAQTTSEVFFTDRQKPTKTKLMFSKGSHNYTKHPRDIIKSIKENNGKKIPLQDLLTVSIGNFLFIDGVEFYELEDYQGYVSEDLINKLRKGEIHLSEIARSEDCNIPEKFLKDPTISQRGIQMLRINSSDITLYTQNDFPLKSKNLVLGATSDKNIARQNMSKEELAILKKLEKEKSSQEKILKKEIDTVMSNMSPTSKKELEEAKQSYAISKKNLSVEINSFADHIINIHVEAYKQLGKSADQISKLETYLSEKYSKIHPTNSVQEPVTNEYENYKHNLHWFNYQEIREIEETHNPSLLYR